MIEHKRLTQQVIFASRRIRHTLIQSEIVQKSREHWLSQLFLGSEAIEIPCRNQNQLDRSFSDLDLLMAAAIPFLFSPRNEQLGESVVRVINALSERYKIGPRTSYFSTAEQSLAEVYRTLHDIRLRGKDAAERWFRINQVQETFDELGPESVLVAPLTTDYIVALLHYTMLTLGESHVPLLFPVGWMPGFYEAALSSQAIETIHDEGVEKIYVMVDSYETGTTSRGIRAALSNIFPDKEIYSR